VGFADIVPAGSSAEGVAHGVEAGSAVRISLAAARTWAGVGFDTLPRFGRGFEALAFLRRCPDRSRGGTLDLVCGREEGERFLRFLAGSSRGRAGRVAAEGGVDEVNIWPGAGRSGRRRCHSPVEDVPEPRCRFCFFVGGIS